MNDRDRIELERLKQRQLELLGQSVELGRKLAELEARLAAPEPPAVIPEPKAMPATPPPIPPIIRKPAIPVLEFQEMVIPQLEPTHIDPPPILEAEAEAPVPPEIVEPYFEPEPQPIPAFAHSQAAPPPEPAAAPVPEKHSSFEMRLGTFWLVRIGIVMLLTGLVFFGNYAYQNYIGRIGPAGKISLLYLASGALLATGAWLQRKKELKNYAQVLLAGGLAAVYFTTYAAHHIPPLQVIRSAVLDGALLLGWAGFIIWLADRKKSEVLALFAVLLAYYTSIITAVGLFTLYSNLILTAAAVFFLVRNRWAALSFMSLVATYASYGFWRFHHQGYWNLPGPDSEGFYAGLYFLIGYWTLFTGAVFLSRNEQFFGNRRAAFVTMNNAAFFSGIIFTMWQMNQGNFWKFGLSYGSVLLALWIVARRFLATDKLVQNAYLTQGLLLVTLGFVTHFAGLKLSLVLATESVMLAILGQQLKSRVMQAGSMIAGLLAVAWSMEFVKEFDREDLLKGVSIGAAMLFNAFWTGRETAYEESQKRPRTIYYTILALAIWLVTTWKNTHEEWRGVVIACETLVFLLASRPLRNQVLNYGAYVFAAVATGWQAYALGYQYFERVINARVGLAPGIILGALMILGALWERSRAVQVYNDKPIYPPVTFFSSLGLFSWLAVTRVFCPDEYFAPLLAGEALLLTASFYVLRLKELPLFGQFFLVLAQFFWLSDFINHHPNRPWWNPACVITITLALAQWWQRQKTLLVEQTVRLVLQGIYALAVVGLLYFWLQPQIAAPTWLACASGLAIALTVYAALNRFWLLAAAGQIFMIVSCCEFIRQVEGTMPEWYLPLAPIATLCLLSFCAAKWFAARPDAKAVIREPILEIGRVYRIVALVMSLWWVHRYIPAQQVCWVLATVGAVLFAVAGWRRNLELLIFSAVFTLAGVVRFWVPDTGIDRVYLPNLLAMLLLLVQQRFARRLPERFKAPWQAEAGAIALGGLSIWFLVSLWISDKPNESYLTLTAGWSVLALVFFITGMALRERIYRWLGLAILACALGRVVFIDVWKLETIFRILSFMALGIVLLVLGFIYNKYQDKIKEWL